MLKFEKNVEDRKELVKRLGELTGIRPVYMRTPTYAFVCGEYTVDREGSLLVDEEAANADVLTALMGEGMITGGEVVEDTEGTAETEDVAVETDTETEPGATEEVAEAEPEATEENVEQNVTEPQEDGEEMEADAETEEFAEAEQQEDTEMENCEAQEVAEPEEPERVENTETEEAADASEPAADTETAIDLNMAFPIPIGRHTGTSLRNLVNLIYSRGALINKATGGHFHVEEELVEALKDDSCAFSKANFLRAVADYEEQNGKSIYGLTFAPEEIQFTGFGEAADVEHLTAYGQLAVLMNEQALGQKRIQAKEVN
ncbi:MAG: hypothetical protein Q4F81_13530, partial [Eubacteriales bacterium]|nr:hypothetical protein [Eubacteriales bacterium]